MEDEVGRLLARTRARREAINSKLKANGEQTKDIPSPLKERNISSDINYSPSKKFHRSEPKKEIQSKSVSCTTSKEDEEAHKIQTEAISKALGKDPDSSTSTTNKAITETKVVITDENPESSVIKKTVITEKEETVERTNILKFSGLDSKAHDKIKKLAFKDLPEIVEDVAQNSGALEDNNKSERKKRLASLANKFNDWEDDTSFGRNTTSKIIDVDERIKNIPVKNKQISKDPSFISNLKAQGFHENNSKSKLVYNFNENRRRSRSLSPVKKYPPVKTISPTRLITPRDPSPSKPHPLQFVSPNRINPRIEKFSPKSQPIKKNLVMQDETNSDTASRRSILEKRSVFECSPRKSSVDPAFLPLNQRKSLFEKNKTAPTPIARFGESVTPSMLRKAQGAPSSEPVWRRRQEERISSKRKSTSPDKINPQKKLFENNVIVDEWKDSDIAKKNEEMKKKDMEVLHKRFIKNIERSPSKSPVKRSPSPVRNAVISPPKSIPDKSPIISPHSNYPGVNSMKRIRLSPPKDSSILYPSVNDIEYESLPRPDTAMSSESETTSEASSLGTIIKRAATTSKSNLQRGVTMPLISETDDEEGGSMDVSQGSEGIDEMLDEALDDSEYAEETPPKISKLSSSSTLRVGAKSPTTSTSSWEFSTPRGTTDNSDNHFKTPLVERMGKNSPGLSGLPEVEGVGSGLLHTVSFYRKQKATSEAPIKIIRNEIPIPVDVSDKDSSRKDLSQRIRKLQEDAKEQEQRMEQASKALNYCVSKDEFEGSAERVEGERLLLEAFHKHSAAMHEVQRLKSEGAMGKSSTLGCKGSVSISGISLSLKNDFVRLINSGADSIVHYFVCLVKYKNQVIATQMLSSVDCISNSRLSFPNLINVRDLDFDFQIQLEVYGLQTRKEYLTHEVKYHIRKEKSVFHLSTPLKKLKKQESSRNQHGLRLQNPVNAKTIRRPSFGKVGSALINIESIKFKRFRLSGVQSDSPLGDEFSMSLRAHSENKVEQRGFLTLFNDVNGFGDWSRRWCLLSGNSLQFWKYPEDESKEDPNYEINLSSCITDNVTLAPKEVCSRMNTFMLETQRRTKPEDKPTLVMHVNKKSGLTRLRHLLMADTRDERLAWCNVLNTALVNLRSWDPTSFRPRSDSEGSEISTTESSSTDIW